MTQVLEKPISSEDNNFIYYKLKANIAFRDFARVIGEKYKSYFEILPESDGGAYVLRPKFNMKK